LSTSHFDATYVAPTEEVGALSTSHFDATYVAPDNADILLIKAKTDNLPADPASNTAVNTRLAATSYVAPDNTDIGLIKAKTDNLPSNPASNTEVDTRLAEADYVAPDNAGIAAIESAVVPTAYFTTDTILDSNNVPLAGARVYLLLTNDHTATPISSDVTDAAGVYKLYAPAPGTYWVLAEDTGYVRSITQVVI
jgi:hypothetical protein